jgi:predicted kinase
MKYKYIFIGTSRSGKSAVAKKFAKRIDGVFVDVVDYVLGFIKKENLVQSECGSQMLKEPYKNLCRDLAKGKKWNVLEVASDAPGENLPKIISALSVKPVLIYCDCPLRICLERNSKSKRIVPEETISKQSRYTKDYYLRLAKKLKIRLIVLDSTQPIQEVFRSLTHKLKEAS